MPDERFEEEAARLLPVWDELASLFLDTDYLGIFGAEKIADRMRASGLSADQIELILLEDILPAFAFNLRDVAGEWAAWHPDFLRERIAEVRTWTPARRWLEGVGVRAAIRRDWKRIRAFLD